jgi:hypothetical protein
MENGSINSINKNEDQPMQNQRIIKQLLSKNNSALINGKKQQ